MPPGSKSRSPWGGSRGWKRVDIPDDFLLGAEEGGFAGLEILEDATILTAGVYCSQLHWQVLPQQAPLLCLG
jgi:hypothetical protein